MNKVELIAVKRVLSEIELVRAANKHLKSQYDLKRRTVKRLLREVAVLKEENLRVKFNQAR